MLKYVLSYRLAHPSNVSFRLVLAQVRTVLQAHLLEYGNFILVYHSCTYSAAGALARVSAACGTGRHAGALRELGGRHLAADRCPRW